MEDMSEMLTCKLLRHLIVNINTVVGTGREHYYLDAGRTLFKLEEAPKGRRP